MLAGSRVMLRADMSKSVCNAVNPNGLASGALPLNGSTGKCRGGGNSTAFECDSKLAPTHSLSALQRPTMPKDTSSTTRRACLAIHDHSEASHDGDSTSPVDAPSNKGAVGLLGSADISTGT